MIVPVYATRVIDVTKEVDVKKSLLEKTLTDLTSYKKIFPSLIKDVKVDPSNKNQAKFVVEAQGTKEADIKSTVKPDGTFVVEILSGDLKGSKIVTTLKERVGFDGTPNGATTVKTKFYLETSMLVSFALSFVGDGQIEEAVGNGFYDLGQYIKVQYPQPKQQQVKVDYKEKPTTTPKLEAAKKLDLEKEKLKVTKTQKTVPKYEAAKKLDASKKPQELSSSIQNTEPMPEIKEAQKLIKKEIVQAAPKIKSYSIKLDPFLRAAHIGDTITFSGTLELMGVNPKGATIYIKDEDPLGDDFMAAGLVDSTGRFYIQWTVRNMDVDSVADVYAVFEGTDVHPRLTTCGNSCVNTIQLETIRYYE